MKNDLENPNKRKSGEDRTSRRGFLKIATALGLGAVVGGPSAVFAGGGIESKEGREMSITPEWKRNIKEIMIWGYVGRVAAKKDAVLGDFPELIHALPDYAEIYLLWNQNMQESYGEISVESLRERYPKKKIHLLEADTDESLLWVQDYMELMQNEKGENTIVVPRTDAPIGPSDGSRSPEDMRFYEETRSIERRFAAGDVERAPFYFEGGNMIADEIDGKSYVFFGWDDVERTAHQLGHDKGVPDGDRDKELIAEAKTLIQNYFKASEVVFLPETSQETEMFHLDQSILPLGSGRMAVTHFDKQAVRKALADENSARREGFLKAYKQQEQINKKLSDLDYELTEVPTSYEQYLDAQFAVNAIPYTDKESGKQNLILPIFLSHIREEFHEEYARGGLSFDSAMLNPAGEELIETFNNLVPPMGVKPVFDNGLTAKGGSLHCATNVLSQIIDRDAASDVVTG